MKSTLFLLALLAGLYSHTGAQPSEGLRKINGTDLFVKIEGTGRAIIVIHGGPGLNHSYFHPHLDALAKKYKLVFYDQRACGRSALPSVDSLSMKFFVDDIEGLRRDLGVDKVVLLAHSWGALLAARYAIEHPANVEAMVLSNPVPMSKQYDAEIAASQRRRHTLRDSIDRSIILGSVEFKAGKSEGYRKLMRLQFRHQFYKASNYSKIRLEMPANFLQASEALHAGLGHDMESYDYYLQLKAVECKVLIIRGKNEVVPLASATRLQTALPHATLIDLDHCDHFAFIEQQSRFRREVEKFLK